MANNDRSVFERLDSIEASQSTTQTQNEEIIALLKKLSNRQPVNQNVEVKPQPQVSEQQLIKNFVKASKKEYVWIGPNEEFKKAKIKMIILCASLIIVGIISTILTSVAFKMYSTFSIFENIWFIFVCAILSSTLKTKKRILDSDLMVYSNTKYIQDDDGTWRNTGKEKKGQKWFRIISYIAVICNIIVIWTQSEGTIAISATLFELAFLGLTIGMTFAHSDLYCMYGSVILFTGKNPYNKNVTLVYDFFEKKLSLYEEYKERMKGYL